MTNYQKELNTLFHPHKTTSKSVSLSFRSLASCVPIPPAPTTKAKPFILLKITALILRNFSCDLRKDLSDLIRKFY